MLTRFERRRWLRPYGWPGRKPPPQLTRQLLPTYNHNYNCSCLRRPEPRRPEPSRSVPRRPSCPSHPSCLYPSRRYPGRPARNHPGQTGKHPRSSCPPLHHSFDELLLHEDGPRGLANDLAHYRRPPSTTFGLTEGTQTLGTLRQPNLTFRYSQGYVSDLTLSDFTDRHHAALG